MTDDHGAPPAGLTRLPPHEEGAERALLGAILLDYKALAAIADMVRPEDFYATAHQRIYDAALRLFGDGKTIDAVMIAAELKEEDNLEKIGGENYLAELCADVPSAAGAEDYARLVRGAAVKRALIHTCTTIQSAAYEGSAGDKLLDQAQSEILALGQMAVERQARGMAELILDAFDDIQQRIDAGGTVTGLPTGFLDIDDQTAGLQRGDMIVVAGRPSMGKTTWAMNVVEHVGIVERKPVCVFTLEVRAIQLVCNMLCSRARVGLQRVRRGQCDSVELTKLQTAGQEFMEAPIYVDDSPTMSPLQMRAKARRIHQATGGLGLIVIDYLQLLEGNTTTRSRNRQEEISEISRNTKAMARELDVPVIAICQLSRKVEDRMGDKRPRMSDLRESGALEQDADLILFLYRECMYNDQADPTHAEMIIAKQRNGPTGKRGLRFFGEIVRFENEAVGVGEEDAEASRQTDWRDGTP